MGADSFKSSASSKHRCANVFLNVRLPVVQLLSKKRCSVHISFREIRNTTKEAGDVSCEGPELPRSPYLELLIPWSFWYFALQKYSALRFLIKSTKWHMICVKIRSWNTECERQKSCCVSLLLAAERFKWGAHGSNQQLPALGTRELH